ncbi:MAG: glycoside hydrolase family 15 protein [Bacteroidales bacterium]|nr:glycoside hydrolase family 15 protein [Bacteroidales bacterium]
MAYQPIENYAIIGNMRSAALVGLNGSIDWFCFPNFDSPSIFASILDEKKGGHFEISPVDPASRCKQYYWPDTNVLITRFYNAEGIVEITDYMPVGDDIVNEFDYRIVRRLKCVHGRVRMKLECYPAFNYAMDTHETTLSEKGATFHAPGLSLGLASTIPLEKNGRGACAEFEIGDEDEPGVFVLHKVEKGEGCTISYSAAQANQRFKNTIEYWRKWLSKSNYKGRWREMVNRSALILKLLTFEPTGAIVAAPTCSLPEGIGGVRNWDYRYTWIRDAAFTIYALLRIGFTEEASSFMAWTLERSMENDSGELQIMYGIDGRHELTERTLDHLEGYMGSSPVRIGNGAWDQLQLDIYGELIDSIYLFDKHVRPVSYYGWNNIYKHINWISENWDRPDDGIWEVRGGQQHFVYSKVMAWVALDRAIRLAKKRSFPADLFEWTRIRDKIFLEVVEKGWNKERQTFDQYYGSNTLDASTLMMPLVFFMSPYDPMMSKTLDAILRPPHKGGLVSNSLVYRYNVNEVNDGLSGDEGTFNICTFWLVEALTRAGKEDPKRLEQARLMFEQMLGYANHVGMYSEQIGLHGEALGNTPQAFTHLALISSAYNLDRALG